MAGIEMWGQNDQERNDAEGECALCEAMCPEAADGTLSAAEQVVFDRHVAACASCGRELEEAQRGAAWLSLLKTQAPEPPAALLGRILAQTSGAQADVLPISSAVENGTEAAAPALVPAMPQIRQLATVVPLAFPAVRTEPVLQSSPGRLLHFRKSLNDVFAIERGQRTFHPRLAMTAAMAFFSIALTLNLLGFPLRQLHAETFTPAGLQRTVADARASAVRSFQNLRVVYQVESRVSELQEQAVPLQNSMQSSAGTHSAPAAAPADSGKRGSR